MPATTDFLPTREADLVQWSSNFDARITATPTAFGLTAPQATAYNALHTAFETAWQTANENVTRTPSAIGTKNTAKQNLINGTGGIRELVAIVQSFPGTTRTERLDLQITVRDSEPSPIPPPPLAPGLDIVSAVARTVKIRLHNSESPSSRARPAGVLGAAVYSFVGDTAPTDIDSWKYEGDTTKLSFDVEFPSSVEPGSVVWVTAYWKNAKLQSGPPCNPVSTNLPGGLAAAA